ncbi:MAG: hypothetical protein M5U34_00595 [Chloroflexi bacterium]|nr:hypothetical protein [Chloroflexota bacterium]
MQNARQTAQLRQTDQQLLHIQELTRQKPRKTCMTIYCPPSANCN